MVRMRVISANVNGIRAAVRRGGLSWLAAAEPDVLCLQEVRASDAELTAALADSAFAGWHVAHAPCGTAGRAGVAILSRTPHRRVRCGGHCISTCYLRFLAARCPAAPPRYC